MSEKTAVCKVCFRHCSLKEGETGFCHARICKNGEVISENYGKVTSLALDPIEKKPLAKFYPGSRILSIGSYGCNLSCKFCQNYGISYSGEKNPVKVPHKIISPKDLCDKAVEAKIKGNIGVAFTYNEPLIGWEYIKDCAKLLKSKNLKVVIVTNGTAELWVLHELLPYTDAMNIDLKAFSEDFYQSTAGGNLNQTKEFIKEAAGKCHIELTSLIIPGLNDSDEEMREMSKWICKLPNGENIPYHITRFFPRHKMSEKNPTEVSKILSLVKIAEESLNFVYKGNC
ncbi:MAG: AmmeMemoRadiSam system radical SAM enzyme [Eubacterium sp.]|nr:AmmeMemoRadiSam system radical SAM enzyme [Eubacterium sp.]